MTGLNAGYRVYQVDSKTFSVTGAQTYIANMSNSLVWTKPVWEFEYDTRDVYADSEAADSGATDTNAVEGDDEQIQPRGIPWPATSPLNATFWHLVTEKMLADAASSSSSSSSGSPSLLDLYNRLESKSSSQVVRRGGGETSPEQKICFLRAGSGALGNQCRNQFGGRDARGLRERAFGML